MASQKSLQIGSSPFDMTPSDCEHFLAFSTKMCQGHLVHSCPIPGVSHFFKVSWFLLVGMVFREHHPEIATGLSLFLNLFSGQSYEICIFQRGKKITSLYQYFQFKFKIIKVLLNIFDFKFPAKKNWILTTYFM